MGGRDKFLLPVGGITLLQRVTERALPQVTELVMNYNGDPEKLFFCGLPLIRDPLADTGPLGGILAGLQMAQDRGYDYLLSFACDVPFVPENYARQLYEAVCAEEADIAVAQSFERAHPVMGIWHVSLAEDLEKYLDGGGRKVMDWLVRQKHTKVVWDETPDPFMNINTPEDLARACKLLG